jgi:hypothetical protein
MKILWKKCSMIFCQTLKPETSDERPLLFGKGGEGGQIISR